MKAAQFIMKTGRFKMVVGLVTAVLALFISPSMSHSLSECSEASERSGSSWVSRKDAYLAGHVVKVSSSRSALQCGHQCLKNSWCISVNFKLDGGKCELNDFGLSQTDMFETELTHKSGFVFYQFAAMDESCHDNPCKNGGSCVSVTSRTLFGMDGCQPAKPKCTCDSAFYGDVCQYKDECASNPCKNGATCVDGSGNYTCSCMAGFSGVDCETGDWGESAAYWLKRRDSITTHK